jgi:hypothetical protein
MLPLTVGAKELETLVGTSCLIPLLRACCLDQLLATSRQVLYDQTEVGGFESDPSRF